MNYTIVHELPGRIRLRCGQYTFLASEASKIADALMKQQGVISVEVYHKTGSILIQYAGNVRSHILYIVKSLNKKDLSCSHTETIPVISSKKRIFQDYFIKIVGNMLIRKFLLPPPISTFLITVKAGGFIRKGLHSLLCKRQIDVSVLDAAAIGISIAQRSYGTAGSIMFLLSLGELLEDWTREKSKENLAHSLALNIDTVWVEKNGMEISVSMDQVAIGDHVVIRTGTIIPVDGVILKGEAMINQAAMTGESLPVRRVSGNRVYAGTVIEEGSIVVRTDAIENETRIQKILTMIDESESLKAGVQSRAERLADSIVPFSFFTSGLIYLLTRNPAKALSVLLVDYSCAIKLATPLAILSAMSEASRHKVLVKGGKFLEAIADADTIVFDKTGTLTVATPQVNQVIPFDEFTREQVLRTAACLEEHFPHSVAKAVVQKAYEEGVLHMEEHTQVDYVVAHGISSHLHGEKVRIGSAHFIFEDEGIIATEEQKRRIDQVAANSSVLYLAVGERLAGLLCIDDPIRPEAKDVIAKLRKQGINTMVMLTGNGTRVARTVSEKLGLDTYFAEVLPEDKANYIQLLREKGHVVMMVGDGVNDSPALAAANVGIAMKNGSDIAREVSDVTLLSADLDELVTVRILSSRVMKRVKFSYNSILLFNTLLLGLSLGGWITPGSSALYHNLSTLAFSMNSLRPLLKDIG